MRKTGMSTDLLLRRASAGLPCWVRDATGTRRALPLDRWMGGASASLADRIADRVMLAGCHGATVDLGCGPGRLTAALVSAGVNALGVDSSVTAVQLTIRRGGVALHSDIFAPLPRSGNWDRVLLADGNIGIGGDPAALLRRVRALCAPGGRVLIEVDPPGAGSRVEPLRLRSGRAVGEWFTWAHVSADAAGALAAACAATVTELWEEAGRWFVALRP